jgi:hypothetical protein
MQPKYKIRTATQKDTPQIRQLIRESVADEKKLLNPSLVSSNFIDEFVDKVIAKGNMVVVENDNSELELIGEIHLYNALSGRTDEVLKEMAFISRKVFSPGNRETELVSWLFGELQQKHQDVFRVELSTPVCHPGAVAHFINMGLRVEGQFSGRLSAREGAHTTMVPLSWINASNN